MSHGCYCYAKATTTLPTLGSRSRSRSSSSSSSSLVVAVRHPVEIKWTPPPPPTTTTTTTTNLFPLMSMSSPERRRHVAASVAFNPQGNYDLPLSLEDDDFDPANVNAPLPPTLGRFEVPIDTNIIRTLDLSPFQSATSVSSDRWAEELMERTVGFSINYKRDDPHDTRELSEMPDVRLWFVRLDATYPWLPVVLDWRAGELARYAAMLVPHQMSLRMGVVFNPEALELFVIKKAFVVYSWLLLHGVPEPKARVKTTDMARMLGFGIGDDLFHLIHLHPVSPSHPPS